ncbi:MAG: DUF1523 family protein [Candidatus Moraniibacteriota bacterium]
MKVIVKSERGFTLLELIPVILLVVALILGLNMWYAWGTSGEKTVVVKSLNNKINPGSEQDQYLVFTKDDGIFKNTDSWFWWKFNSSDIQNQLTAGMPYRIKHYGWRWGFFSLYPNIVEAKESK